MTYSVCIRGSLAWRCRGEGVGGGRGGDPPPQQTRQFLFSPWFLPPRGRRVQGQILPVLRAGGE